MKATLEAQYLGGYTVECSLKALILHLTPDRDKQERLKQITSGAQMHQADVLLGVLRDLGVTLPPALVRRMRRFYRWEPSLRYETGRRDTSETVGFLKTAAAVYNWVEGQLP